MYKKLFLTALLGLGVAAFNAGCDKKDSNSGNEQQPSPTASRNDTVFAGPANVEFGPNVDQAQANNVLAKLNSQMPGISASRLENAPVPGFYQVLADGDVFYVSNDGNYMFVGDVYDVNKSTRQSLTEDLRKQSRLAVINNIPESDMVVYTPKGNVEHTITVFTDIDCGYCRKFHQEMNDYLAKGIKVRYMAFPRAGIGSSSYNKVKTVWCSEDPNKAMDSAKLANDFQAAEKLCDNKAVDNSMAVVRKLGLRGTPALLLDDGTLLPGYMPADKLRAALDRNKQQSLSQTGNRDSNAG